MQKEKSTFSYTAEDGSLKTRMQIRVANAGGAEKHPVTKEDLKIFTGAIAHCFILRAIQTLHLQKLYGSL